MGYRSDVRIRLTEKDFERLKREYENEIKDNLFQCLDIETHYKAFVQNEETDEWSEIDTVYFGWNYVKWYEGYNDVNFIMKFIRSGCPSAYTRIGENIDDIEQEYHMMDDIPIRILFDDRGETL